MARSTALARPNIRVVIPRAARTAGRLARRAGTAAAAVARDEKHTIAAVGAAAVVGYMQRSGTQLPHVAAIGMPGTYGLVAWMGARMTKNKTLAHVATGLLSVAAFQMTASGSFFGGTAAPPQPQLQPVGPGGMQGVSGTL